MKSNTSSWKYNKNLESDFNLKHNDSSLCLIKERKEQRAKSHYKFRNKRDKKTTNNHLKSYEMDGMINLSLTYSIAYLNNSINIKAQNSVLRSKMFKSTYYF